MHSRFLLSKMTCAKLLQWWSLRLSNTQLTQVGACSSETLKYIQCNKDNKNRRYPRYRATALREQYCVLQRSMIAAKRAKNKQNTRENTKIRKRQKRAAKVKKGRHKGNGQSVNLDMERWEPSGTSTLTTHHSCYYKAVRHVNEYTVVYDSRDL